MLQVHPPMLCRQCLHSSQHCSCFLQLIKQTCSWHILTKTNNFWWRMWTNKQKEKSKSHFRRDQHTDFWHNLLLKQIQVSKNQPYTERRWAQICRCYFCLCQVILSLCFNGLISKSMTRNFQSFLSAGQRNC